VLIIDERFNGPPGSGNGGFSCGLVAAVIPAAAGVAEVTLRTPPPLGTQLRVEPRDNGIAVLADEMLVAEGRRVTGAIHSPGFVDFEVATAASRGYLGFHDHPYPSCFVCGPERAIGDGLRIFPGAVDGRDVVAAPWIPDGSVADERGDVPDAIIWAALDCPSWFAFAAFDAWQGRPLLGRLAAEILARPRAGDHLVSVAQSSSRDGRKVHSGAALFADDGTLLARSRATWILVP
jgi:hypothetical protein